VFLPGSRTTARENDINRFAFGIEDYLHLAVIKLAHHLRHLDLERDVALAILGSLSQNEGLHDGAKHVGG
jgi:hypothetical protein